MPLYAQRGFAHAVAAAHHGHGRGRHQECHEAIAHHAGRRSHDELRRARDLLERPRIAGHGSGLGRRQAQAHEQGQGQQSQSRLAVEAASERRGGQGVACPDHHLRADDGRNQSADHDPRDRLGLLRRFVHQIGGRKAVALHAGRVEPGQCRAYAESHEIGMRNALGRDDARHHAQQRTQYIGLAPAQAVHQPGRGQGGQGQAQLVDADRQRGRRGIARQLLADQAAQRDDDGRRGASQGLGRNQQAHIAAGVVICAHEVAKMHCQRQDWAILPQAYWLCIKSRQQRPANL